MRSKDDITGWLAFAAFIFLGAVTLWSGKRHIHLNDVLAFLQQFGLGQYGDGATA